MSLSVHVWMLILGQACALLSDLEILEDGDQSEIGERGVSHTVDGPACSL